MAICDAALIAGKTVDRETGLLVDDASCWTNWEPIELASGSAVVRVAEGFRYRLWCYVAEYDDSLAFEYSYDPESNWTTLKAGIAPDEWLTSPYTFTEPCFVRISVQRVSQDEDAAVASAPQVLSDAVELDVEPVELPPMPACFADEIERVCAGVEQAREPDDAVLIALSDVHYSTGCIWPETARNIQTVAARIAPDAIVQLGDMTDGLAPVAVTKSFVARVLGGLQACGVPVLSCIGNHDVNYFRGNAERFTLEDAAKLCTGRDELCYYEDLPDKQLRLIFLNSFDPAREERYGYERAYVRWLRRTLRRTPKGYRVIAFSHVPPLPEIHHWSDTILNGQRVLDALERFNRRRKGAVLAFVHGHNHVDQVYWHQSFPIVAIGAAKFEDFQECKPAGSITPARKRGTASQELWDVLVVNAREGRVDFIRFGAGDDLHFAMKPDGSMAAR